VEFGVTIDMAQGIGCQVTWHPPESVTIYYHMPNTAPTTVGVSGVPAHLNYGVPVSLTATWRDPDGYGNISYTHLLIRNGVDGTNACYLYFIPGSNQVYLRDAASSTWGSPITMGSGSLDNGWCHVNGAGSSFGTSGSTDRTATVSVFFYPSMLAYGTLYHYLYVQDTANANSGWQGSYGSTALHSGPKLIVTTNR
jgi:hypothetical protein